MIITIRGPSGSGKSTLTRMIMEHYKPRVPIMKPGRKQPLAYSLEPLDRPGPSLIVLGHYESPTGGGDTLSDGLDYIESLTKEYADQGFDVLYEGLVVTSDFKRILNFYKTGYPAAAIVLNTPQEMCEASVNARRRARGNDKPVRPDDIRSKITVSRNHIPRWKAEGFDKVFLLSREDAYLKACELLNLRPDYARVQAKITGE